MVAPSLHIFGLQRIFNSLVVSLIFNGLQLALRDLVINTMDLVYVQSERKDKKKEKDRKEKDVVGLQKSSSSPLVVSSLVC